jgi:hypothetical protein
MHRRRKRGRRGVVAQPRRRQPVARAKQRVEAPQAPEAARERNVEQRQRRVGQQPLGEQQPLRLRVFDRRYAELSSNTRRK